ncbi:TPR-domain containing protein [Sulfitobacter noctilucae]|uniref:tetratricopeptide repeat protein n=1 Tax=Sulfitobacter noctilucae TaxID=1342302 RepID=UPI000469DC6C|nr:tetratricopeptide repeat protein [Sulfitobacter noctilucae]KIN60434.1 TPR-domain containing protein [Sulfitobacter noctilucae]
MRILPVNLKRHLAAIVLPVLLCGPALAAPAPAELFEKLQSSTAQEAPRVVKEIELEWSRSGSAAMDLLLRRGRDAMQDGNFGLAIEHLTALTDHAPRFAEGYHARAKAYFRANLYGPALDDLETTLALDPTHFDAIFGLAVLFQEFGDLRKAASLYREVLALHPNHENASKALTRLRRDGIGREI